MVCDHSFAILNALVQSFHRISLIEYVNLESETLPVIKICYIHELKAVLDSVKYDKTQNRRFVKNVGIYRCFIFADFFFIRSFLDGCGQLI